MATLAEYGYQPANDGGAAQKTLRTGQPYGGFADFLVIAFIERDFRNFLLI